MILNKGLNKFIMKSEFEKMRSQEMYSYADPEIAEDIKRANALCIELNKLTAFDIRYRDVINSLIPNFPASSVITPPFHCDHGNGIVMGDNSFVNYGCIILDGAVVTFGNNVKVGPNCQFYTPSHPKGFVERRKPQETSYPIYIGDDTWLGGGVIVCPGVKIGERCIIGAGSVVINDIPDDSMAAGNPCVVKKSLI